MQGEFQYIAVDRQGEVVCVRFRRTQMSETDILEMADELLTLIDQQGCRKLVLSLGPKELDCLYSVFLSKLVMVQRHLVECGGALKICQASPATIEVFEACHLKEHFDFVPDQAAAIAALAG
jgi:anti-sigma B factor antagonist